MEDEIAHIARHFEELAAQIEASGASGGEREWNGFHHVARPPRALQSSAHWWASSSTPSYDARELSIVAGAFERAVTSIGHRLAAIEAQLGAREDKEAELQHPSPAPAPVALAAPGLGAKDATPAAPETPGFAQEMNQLLISLKAGQSGMREEVRNIASRLEQLESDARAAQTLAVAIEECTALVRSLESRLSVPADPDTTGLATLDTLERFAGEVGARLSCIEDAVRAQQTTAATSNGTFERLVTELDELREVLDKTMSEATMQPAGQTAQPQLAVIADGLEMLNLRIDQLAAAGLEQRSVAARDESETRLATIEETLSLLTAHIGRMSSLVDQPDGRSPLAADGTTGTALLSIEAKVDAATFELTRVVSLIDRIEGRLNEVDDAIRERARARAVSFDTEGVEASPNDDGASGTVEMESTEGIDQLALEDVESLPFDSSERPIGYGERRHLFRRITS